MNLDDRALDLDYLPGMSYLHIPFLFLLVAVPLALGNFKKTAFFVYSFAFATGLLAATLTPIALAPVFGLALTGWIANRSTDSRAKRLVGLGLFTFLALLLSLHLVPGFQNPRVFDHVRFAEDSVPFTMYLNFDKVTAGLAICFFFYQPLRKFVSGYQFAILIWVALVGLFAVLALSLNFVRFDPKLAEGFQYWILNNFFFVCFAEEAFFRGLLQNQFSKWLPLSWAWLAVGTSAVLFGLAHHQGGVTYIIFATLAGLAYGATFHRTQRLEFSMLVHFGLNAVHFFLFSYPALQP